VIAAAQGDVETAERGAAELYGPSWDQEVQGRDFWTLWALIHLLASLGRYAAAETALEEMAAGCRESESNTYLMRCLSWLMWTKAHLGRYGQARTLAEEERTLTGQMGTAFMSTQAVRCLGGLALAEGRYGAAQQLLEEAAALHRQHGGRDSLGQALATVGLAERRQGQSARAWAHAREALQIAVEVEAFDPLAVGLLAAALLLADGGQRERAVELGALLSRYRTVSESRWYEDVAGAELAAVAASLPPQVREAAQARGRARDLWVTAGELLAELEEAHSPCPLASLRAGCLP
jgi:tetratricopeptide (TPR) repeat protein